MVPFMGKEKGNPPRSSIMAERVNQIEGDVVGDQKDLEPRNTPQENANKKKRKGSDGVAESNSRSPGSNENLA